MDLLHKGWFTEFSPDDAEEMQHGEKHSQKKMKLGEVELGAWSGQAFSLQVDELLFSGKSKFQDVIVFKSRSYGNVLVLDGVIQTTDRDEFAYQEMLTHLPMFSHPNPKDVLIIGGGDGGILREVLKHPSVERVEMCEIDEMVVEVAKKYLPTLSKCFSSKKLTLHIGDGFEYMRRRKNNFDLIITDSSDPIGPAESLFTDSYYKLIFEALKDDGILSSQAESIWLHQALIKKLIESVRKIFPTVEYATSMVPTYPSGSIGYLIASKKTRDLKKPTREISDGDCEKLGLHYYNSQIHRAAFVLPNFAKKIIS